MRRSIFSGVVAIALAFGLAEPAMAQAITGSGSTFAFPIMAKWEAAYQSATGLEIDYHPTGSVAGELDIRAGVVDFGISDAPQVDAQLLRDGLVQFPIVMGAIVPVVNLPGVRSGQLHLSGALLASIYLGRVKRWRDPAIVAANPGVTLPDWPILVVHRSDGSGTTFNWASYLSQASADWRGQVGTSTKVAWPVGVGAKGTGGVAMAVTRVKGAIGYIEYSAAKQAKLTYALVDNRAGHFVEPDPESFHAALDGVDWAKTPDFAVVLTDTSVADAYPLMATSFVLTAAYPKDPERQKAMLGFFRWVLENGQEMASAQDYLPVPSTVTRLVEASWPPAPPSGQSQTADK